MFRNGINNVLISIARIIVVVIIIPCMNGG